MAEYLLVPSRRHLVELPEGLDPVHAAPLTDAGLTPYHAVRRSREKLGPSSTVTVIGVGGLGHLAVQILKATSAARVVAVDTRENARDLAKLYGADAVAAPGDGALEAIHETSHGLGSDVVLDFVGSDQTLALAVAGARQLADITIVGIAGGTLPVSFFGLPYEVSVQTTYWGNRADSRGGMLHTEISRFELEAPVAYAQGDGRHRRTSRRGPPPGVHAMSTPTLTAPVVHASMSHHTATVAEVVAASRTGTRGGHLL